MRRYGVWCGVVLLWVTPLRAEPTPLKVMRETWDAAYLAGAKTGHFHTTVHEIERDGKKLYRTTLAMELSIKRYNAVVTLRMETGTEETPDGKVRRLWQTQFVDRGQTVLSGTVEGGELVVRAANDPDGRRVPWNDAVLGMYAQERLFQDKKARAGDRFEYLNYELGLLSAVKVKAVVKEPEEVDLLEVVPGEGKLRVGSVRKKLLRVEAMPDKVILEGKPIALPGMTSWLDRDLMPVRSEMEMPGLGKVTLYRTTREVARQEGLVPAQMPDLGMNALIPLNRAIDRPNAARSVVYRVTVKGDEDPATLFVQDNRQTVRNVKGNSFELEVRAVREPAEVGGASSAKEEFLKSTYFLDSADEKVQALARRVVGRETDPWRKALAIEKWVHDNMRPSSSIGFATASQVARDLEGDCRQHAMLMAALCRAAGVPARTALGLVYVDDDGKKPVLGFHMWTEVWVQGQWLGLDAVWGQGGVDPGHLKIADHSWQDLQPLAPFLAVTRVLSKITVEVVRVE